MLEETKQLFNGGKQDGTRNMIETYYGLLDKQEAPIHIWYKLRKVIVNGIFVLEILNKDDERIGSVVAMYYEPDELWQIDEAIADIIIEYERSRSILFKQCATGADDLAKNLDVAFKAIDVMAVALSKRVDMLSLGDEDGKTIFNELYKKFKDDETMRSTDELKFGNLERKKFYRGIKDKIDPEPPKVYDDDEELIIVEEDPFDFNNEENVDE